MKKCGKCEKYQVVSEFYKSKSNKDGLTGKCKKCSIQYQKQYCKDNKEKVKQREKQYRKQYKKRKWTTDPAYRIQCSLRAGIRRIIKTGSKTQALKDYLGCSGQELKQYIESQFKLGMNWDNYGLKGWHIDHRIPIITIKSEDDIAQLKIVCHYTNLQPLWAKENQSKGAKIIKNC
ncbi:hypothetical protein LCGC14_1614950 [marine sediment metagenome]|uniref:Uncharacterized protein n=1 Tax=marine sediment metagenome TaxID=412755 RepID=A0A0F9L788_9ZZZZ